MPENATTKEGRIIAAWRRALFDDENNITNAMDIIVVFIVGVRAKSMTSQRRGGKLFVIDDDSLPHAWAGGGGGGGGRAGRQGGLTKLSYWFLLEVRAETPTARPEFRTVHKVLTIQPTRIVSYYCLSTSTTGQHSRLNF